MGTVELPPLEKAINYGVTAISSSDSELVDEASKLLSMELSKFKHITENYANEKYEDSFNWNELELPEYIEKDFYAVVFRSKRRQDNDYDLYKADRLAHEEAVHASKGNLLMYCKIRHFVCRNLSNSLHRVWNNQ